MPHNQGSHNDSPLQPVKIERIASEQTETLNASIGDAFTLDGAVDTIYESCLTERGFR